ncbi:putative late blight resistance protein homolog R1A-10 isoform X2 [Salvia splendens]|uniref:putative late blight resistance protein homolog R1A-10 isoform X2 n=1 Tax=Salvia splendens TaxID=180675 RepID=UPI001C262268|nr:putative late blight resistance protein homolog R1A-10 isoform X2 [Salvia splendens]
MKLEPLQTIVNSLEYTSPSRSRKKVNALDRRVKEAIWKFEDSLESLITQHIPETDIVSIDLQSLLNDANSLIQKLKVMEKEYSYEVDNMPQDGPISSIIGFHGTNSKMIGLSDQFKQLKRDLITAGSGSWIHFHALYGTAGVGKTALAMKIYEDPEIQSKYECRAWVTVGRVPPQPMTPISQGILAQLCGIDEEIGECLEERLHGKNCLIVLDDVWETRRWNLSEDILTNINTGGGGIQILLTSRHQKLMSGLRYKIDLSRGMSIKSWYEVRFLNEEESMELLCEKVFGDEGCPPQLHKLATKISKLCEGLPLLILNVAHILSESEHNRDPFYWNEVAEMKNSVFKDAYNEISKVLLPSYHYLPERLKMPFLFIGVFAQDYYTPISKITLMLKAEGLWDNWDCLRELAIDYSLVLCSMKSVNKNDTKKYIGEYKTCRLHSSWRHVCREEASKYKFYHVLNKLIDAKEESLKGQRGLCLENNILFSIREFCNSVRSNCAFSTRSLLFYGPYHQYPIPIDVSFMLLREIDALQLRFYTFPTEILSLVQLKYLALTCNGEVPATISKLFNLRALIIHPHLNIICCESPSYVPIQIWDMHELEHIEILGKSLGAPSHVAAYLKNLKTLVGVNASICTVLELSTRIPNIRKLGIQIELTPYDDHNNLLSCFDCISSLESLKTLKLSITNPVVNHGNVFLVTRESLKFPQGLKKLHMSGMGFPWEYMDVIGSLPILRVLKLRSYAFQGSHWEAQDGSFRSLQFLLIEESDLVQWKPGYGSFSRLKYLSMKHCYKLKKIHGSPFLNQHGRTIEIELEDCNPLALTWAVQLRPSIGSTLRVIAFSSFYKKPTTFKSERYGGDIIVQQRRILYSRVADDDIEEIIDCAMQRFEEDGSLMPKHQRQGACGSIWTLFDAVFGCLGFKETSLRR